MWDCLVEDTRVRDLRTAVLATVGRGIRSLIQLLLAADSLLLSEVCDIFPEREPQAPQRRTREE